MSIERRALRYRLHSKASWLALSAALLGGFACDSSETAGPGGTGAGGGAVVCEPSATSEQSCSDGIDDDCDGFPDCLDPDCDGKACDDAGRSCLAGACLGESPLPQVPRIDNLVVTVRADTAIVDFSAVDGAKDYRVYPLPDEHDVLVGTNGEVVVRDAIYRCGGAHPRDNRQTDAINGFDMTFTANVGGYTRSESEAVLGHVYLTPAADRVPVYRVANPNLVGGYVWEYLVPPAKEFNGAEYVDSVEERDELVAQGWRDDGIAFYVSKNGKRNVYRREYADTGLSVFYTDGPEKAARDAQGGSAGVSFKVLDAEGPDTVPLYRLFYFFHNDHDVLAAGEANRERVLYQGNLPITSVSWPGLKGETTLVVEALDSGCPFPNGFVGAMRADGIDGGVVVPPTITLNDARLATGEVFINGQYEPENRPKAIARGYVTVKPKPHPDMDWFESFDPDKKLAPFQTIVDDGNYTRVFRNGKLSVELPMGGNGMYAYGPLLGQLAIGSNSGYNIVALGADAKLEANSYLHVTMAVDIPSTGRRYPQIMVTDAPLGHPDEIHSSSVPMVSHLGPMPVDNAPPGDYHTIIVQTFFQPQLEIQFCDQRGWGVSQQCPKANIYGYPESSPEEPWTRPWLPNPVLGEFAGTDRLVKFDAYFSTNRVYVFVEDRPMGCAVLPPQRFPGGPVNVVFSSTAYHIDIDEQVERDPPRHEYWRRYSLGYVERKVDDLGVKSGVNAPAWDESILPCGDRFYGGAE
jgi:hypothetical protein